MNPHSLSRQSARNLSIVMVIFTAFQTNLAFAITRTWTGAGAGGIGTDFNDAANWSPVGSPTSDDDIVIALTSTATIQLSQSSEIKSLEFKSPTAGQVAILDLDGYDLTVEAQTSIEGNAGTARIGENSPSGAGRMFFKGDFTITSSNTGTGALIGNESSKAVFYKNVNINLDQATNWNTQNSNVVFDAPGNQTITWNGNQNINFRNVTIGDENNPNLGLAGNVYGNINGFSGDMTINGSSSLNLSNGSWNPSNNTATFYLNDSAQLVVTKTDGGMGTSNFPVGYGTYDFSENSTVTYTGGHVQELPGGALYGNLVIGANTQANWNANNIRVANNFSISSGFSFDLQGKHLHVGGNWLNNGTFQAQNTGKVTFNGSDDQYIEGLSTEFVFLEINKPDGEVVLSTDTDVGDKLTLTQGLVTTGDYRVRVGNRNHLGAIDGGNGDSYINGRLERGIVNWSNAQIGLGSEQFFPVGKGGNYRPVYLNFNSMNAASWVSVEQFETGFLGTAPVDYYTPARYWNVDVVDAATFNFTIRLDGSDTPLAADTKILRYDPSLTTTDAYDTSLSSPVYSSSSIVGDGHFALSPNNDSMPVVLSMFSVGHSENNVKLFWNTTSETNSDRFEIERSVNPVLGFEKIGAKKSQNSQEGAAYDFTDEKTPLRNILYYRLKMIDYDGSFEYSRIESVSITRHKSSFIYPNPANHQIKISVPDPAEITTISIYDLSGRQLFKRKGNDTVKIIPTANLSSGLYLAKLTRENGESEILRFTIQK